MLSEYVESVLMCCALAYEDVSNVSPMKDDTLCTVKLLRFFVVWGKENKNTE